MIKKKELSDITESGTFHLGNDLFIHRLGFGAMRLTGPNIWGPPKDIEAAKRVLHRAIDLGINFIDTADSYGPEVSENIIAEALYPYPESLVIATKGGLTRPSPGSWEPFGHPDYLIQCVEGSLKRLRMDCIPLYQLHAIDPQVPIEDSINALKRMQDQGKIKHIGLSNVSIEEIERAKKIANIVSIQNQYNLSNRKSEDVISYCEKNKLAFIPWYPLGSGHLANAGGELHHIAKSKGVTDAQLVLAWLLKHSEVMVPIPGTASLRHLEENVAAASVHFNEQELALLDQFNHWF